MYLGKTLRLTLLSMALGFGVVRSVSAQAAASFAQQVQPDALTIAQFVNAPFAKSMGFISTLGWNTPPGVFELTTVAGPHVEVGVGAAADLMNFPSLSTLNL